MTRMRWRRLSAGLLFGFALSAGTPAWSQPVAAPAAAAPGAAASAPRPRIGLVLAGGGARGGAHLGVLKVLEEQHVPIDVIVGTSAGAIVGAAYASGMPLADIEAQMKPLTTASLFRDRSREDVPMRRKADDQLNYIGPEVGVSLEGLRLPKGAVAGVALEAVLRRLTVRQRESDFDKLPIRFRAVATDAATAEMVVLDHGSLERAIRASMAIPAVINPVEIDGRLLVDGGLSRNLPVDVARGLGAQVVIAVNIGTPLLPRKDITSLLSMSDQLVRILTNTNVNVSLKEVGPDDVLITPDLGDVGTADFDRIAEAAAAGEQAARGVTEQLARLGIDAEAYSALAAARTAQPSTGEIRIAAVEVKGVERVNPEAVLGPMHTQRGDTFDPAVAEADMRRIYGSGDFESVSYYLHEQPGGGYVMTTDVTEKSWGPNYLRFGLSLSTDFEGRSYFNLLATHRWTWLNSLGAEWRNDVQIGNNERLRTEWHQPLSPAQRWFVALGAEYASDPFDVYVDGQRVSRFTRDIEQVDLAAGVPFGRAGEIRLGVVRGRARLGDDTSLIPASLLSPPQAVGGAQLRLRLDQLDSLSFPRQGYALDAKLFRSRKAIGADQDFDRLSLNAQGALSWHRHTLQLGIQGSMAIGSEDLPFYELSSLGGFLRLSGYRTGEFLGRDMRFGRLVYNYRIAGPGFLDGVSLGLSTEIGRMTSEVNSLAQTRHGNAIYIAADTPLGPVYVGYGRASSSNQAVYIYLGLP
ncbi:MAG TPA: patatin-like phospholipase family protein [Burkholderiaceae bacterium]|nr:patatin-like phospholipase family protein [Burkholderiaceae bacterium]